MRKVITVSLNGNAFQLEDDACAALSAYLDEAARALAANPDRAEIISDLEQAIADKCIAYLNPHKNVLTLSEVQQVITQMGAVDAEPAPSAGGAQPGTAGASAAGNAGDASAPRRLYQISEGAMISGICNGYAAYSGLDVTWIRVIFVLLAVVTGGLGAIAYVVLMFIIPYANTSEERAAAHGLPFNARLLVENAKRQYSQFAKDSRQGWNKSSCGNTSSTNDWRRAKAEWRLERMRMKQEWKRTRQEWKRGYGRYAPPPPAGGATTIPPPPAPYFAHVLTGTVVAILGLVSAAVALVAIATIFSLINSHTILGWPLPSGIPLWVGVVGLIWIWHIVTIPIRAARHAAWYGGGYHDHWHTASDSIVTLAILFGLGWWAVHHVPEIREFIQNLPQLWEHTTHALEQTAAKVVVEGCTTIKNWLLLASPKVG